MSFNNIEKVCIHNTDGCDVTSAFAIATGDIYSPTYSIAEMLNDIVGKTTGFVNGVKNVVEFVGGKVVVTYPNSLNSVCVMPEIVNVHTIENNGEVKVVVVSFADGTSEKAVLSADDTFSLEYGISICVTKRLLSGKCDGHGNSVYNKIVRHGLKVYENAQKKAEKDAEEAERIKTKMTKLAQKKAAKRAKREAAEREYLIGIQAEAYVRAMRELNASTNVAE